jgi:hypothetical protein
MIAVSPDEVDAVVPARSIDVALIADGVVVGEPSEADRRLRLPVDGVTGQISTNRSCRPDDSAPRAT